MKKKRSICFSFICQAGELELKALLLVASLRHHNPNLSAELIAAIPNEQLWGEVSEATKALLRHWEVKLQSIESPFGKEYPIGNKFAALGVKTKADVTVFLDSDILCLRPFSEQVFATDGLLMKPADLNTFSYDIGQWQQAYQVFDLELPEQKVLSTISKELMQPYFNAGLIAVANGPKFAEQWLAVAKKIDADETVLNKRPWLDQITLPIAAKYVGYSLQCLTESYNYPAHLRCINETAPPVLCHYHWPKVIEQEAVLSDLVGLLASQNNQIVQLIAEYPEWRGVLTRAEWHNKKQRKWFNWGVSKAALINSKNFLITGLPRSGTSLLCNLLNSAENVVVINEPEEIFSALEQEVGQNVELYYRQLRTDIILGRQITNKVNEQGDIIEDTRFDDQRREYRPDIHNANFLLGSKNPLAYLTRLQHLCDEIPQMAKIAMIRHPFAVINSWKKSFSHLERVDLQRFPFAGDPTLLDDFQRKSLAQINDESSSIVKRALLWRYLAELIWRDRHRVTVVLYEDLLSDPSSVLEEVFSAIGDTSKRAVNTKHIRPSAKTSELDEHERNIISLVCGDVMEKWGYDSDL